MLLFVKFANGVGFWKTFTWEFDLFRWNRSSLVCQRSICFSRVYALLLKAVALIIGVATIVFLLFRLFMFSGNWVLLPDGLNIILQVLIPSVVLTRSQVIINGSEKLWIGELGDAALALSVVVARVLWAQHHAVHFGGEMLIWNIHCTDIAVVRTQLLSAMLEVTLRPGVDLLNLVFVEALSDSTFHRWAIWNA